MEDEKHNIIGDPIDRLEKKSRLIVIKKIYHQKPNEEADMMDCSWDKFCSVEDLYSRTFKCGIEPQPLDKDGRSWVAKIGMIYIENIGDTQLQIGDWVIEPKTSFDGTPVSPLFIKSDDGNGKYKLRIIPE